MKRQIFGDASGQTSALILTVCAVARPSLICRALPQLHYTYITHVHTISVWHARLYAKQDAAIFGGLAIIYQNTNIVKFQIQNRYASNMRAIYPKK